MKEALEVIAGALLLTACAGALIVLWGLLSGGLDDVPMVGLVLVVVGGIPVATRLGHALRGLRRMWSWMVPS